MTKPETHYLIMEEGAPQISYGRQEDAEGWKVENNRPDAQIVPITYVAFATWGLGTSRREAG